MMEPHVPEIRQELAAARVAALQRSATNAAPGRLRRAAASGLVRLGLWLGYDGSVGARLEPCTDTGSMGARLEPGTYAVSLRVRT